MGTYDFLHARNELAHNNKMILQASGTICLWLFYKKYSDLDDFLTVTTAIAIRKKIIIKTLKLVKPSVEKVHKHLLQTNMEQVDVFFLTLQIEENQELIDEFLGQDWILSITNQTAEIPNLDITFNLSTKDGKDKWEAWLLANIASHEIEFYEP